LAVRNLKITNKDNLSESLIGITLNYTHPLPVSNLTLEKRIKA
jgi:hypothetical protein